MSCPRYEIVTCEQKSNQVSIIKLTEEKIGKENKEQTRVKQK
jgi:hypothetical protein